MDHIILASEGMGPFQFLTLFLASGTLCAYIILRRGLLTGLATMGLVCAGWIKLLNIEGPFWHHVGLWYMFLWFSTFSMIGLLRVMALVGEGHLRMFSSDLMPEAE